MYFLREKFNSSISSTELAERAQIYAVITGCFLLVAAENIVGLVVLLRCKRLPLQIKILSMNMTVSDLIFGSAGGLAYGIHIWRGSLPYLDRVCQCIFESLTTLAVLNITVFSVDRLLNLEFAMKYQVYVTRCKMTAICCSLWLFSIGSAGLMQQLGPRKDGRLFKIVLRSVFLLTFSIANLKIFRITQKHSQTVSDLNTLTPSRMFKNQVVLAQKVIFITGPHFVLFLLVIALDISLYCRPDKLTHGLWEMFIVFISVTSSLVTPLMYIWRFRECRIQFLLLLCACNEAERGKLLSERNRLYEPFLEPDLKHTTRLKNLMKQ